MRIPSHMLINGQPKEIKILYYHRPFDRLSYVKRKYTPQLDVSLW